jgi:preprotein translocase subunit SecG
MQTLLIIIHVIVCLFLCLVVLLQSGRGGGMGAALGGASSQIFGGRGAGNFLTRMTSICAVVFFLTSLTLSMLSSRQNSVVRPKAPVAAAPSADVTQGAEAPAAATPEAQPEGQPAATPPEATPPPAAAPAPSDQKPAEQH